VKPAHALTVAALVVGSCWLPSPGARAADTGEDVTTVVVTDTIHQTRTRTVMCPAGSRALGGGVVAVAQADEIAPKGWVFYTAPVDGSGNPASADTGDIPAGWTVTVLSFNQDTQWKWFATCAKRSDATIVAFDPPADSSGAHTRTVACPAGTRAVGGGLAQGDPNKLLGDDDVVTVIIQSTTPVDNTDSPFNTRDGDAAVGWQTTVANEGGLFGTKYVAICSATSDATVVRAMTPKVDTTGYSAGATATCPAGKAAVSGGLGATGPTSFERLDFLAPVAGAIGIAAAQSGAVPTSWFGGGRDDANSGATRYVFALCATPVPPDTTAPDTIKGKGPKKKTFARKATFTFSSEPGATFTCQLDKKAAKPCASPFKVKKLEPGKHKLVVAATDAAGNTDPTPATYKWKVKKKPKVQHRGCTGECRLAAGGYRTYVACSTKVSAAPAAECAVSQAKAALFRSARHDAVYKVCVKFPGKKKRLCAGAQQAEQGKTKVVTITSPRLGKHKVTWYVAGKRVGAWKFDVVAG
jgi:hypothetical protein